MGQYFGSRVGLLVLVTLTKDWRENFSATEHFVISPIAIDFTKLHFDRVPLMSKMSLTNLSHAIHKRLQDVHMMSRGVLCTFSVGLMFTGIACIAFWLSSYQHVKRFPLF